MRYLQLFLFCCAAPALAQQAPDLLLLNGKIVTVDEQFSIRQAVAIRGERIVAVGDSERLRASAGPATRIVDLGGRTVIPGLIDNHNHVIRATEYWPNEARLDGVTSRADALARLAAKEAALAEGDWLMTLGGWIETQFTDSRADLTLAELDAIAPDRPAFVQAVYDHAYGNTAWFEAMGIPLVLDAASRRAATGLGARVLRDAQGRITGRLDGGFPMIALAIERFPPVPAERQTAAIRTAFGYLNGIGLTSVFDPGGLGIKQESYGRIAALANAGELTVRIFHTLSAGVPATPEEARALVERIETARPFQGSDAFDLIAMGEIYYGPFHWDNELEPRRPTAEDNAVGRAILTAAAAGGWSVQTHSMQPETIDNLLDVIASINADFPLRQLRWSVTHADNIGAPEIERVRALGMNLQLRSISVLGNRAAVFERFGDAAYHMPPLRLVQDSGVPFGLGTDGTKAGQIDPFVTLWWAVTGRALNGQVVLEETLTREEALIAHTRSNAYLMFQEGRLGALKPGLLADLLVLDRDYLTVPADEIKSIRPVATLVGGRLVHGSL
ncbi:MAG TPA: amidohydrolase family protein [Gammaproteobacteria bacterium]|nr:amidohydrolase family protein [Gammaproteobacteria bacterium]